MQFKKLSALGLGLGLGRARFSHPQSDRCNCDVYDLAHGTILLTIPEILARHR